MLKTPEIHAEYDPVLRTQVGFPAVLFRLARCTSWVKRWSEAMDFFQTIFKITIVYLRDLYGKKTPEFDET